MIARGWFAAALVGTALASATVVAAPARKAAQKAGAQRDWSRTVVATPEGGFRMGNPQAPIKLIEYGSLTCPHCAHFETEGLPQLTQKYVRSGRVSFEFRNFVRDPYDMAGALVSRCAGARAYFPLTHQIFASQDQWTGRFAALTPGEYDALEALPQTAKLNRISTIAGFDALAVRYGVPAARAKACLSDAKAAENLTKIRQAAVDRYQLRGTPTFVLNGRNLNVTTWASLEPLLRPPGG